MLTLMLAFGEFPCQLKCHYIEVICCEVEITSYGINGIVMYKNV